MGMCDIPPVLALLLGHPVVVKPPSAIRGAASASEASTAAAAAAVVAHGMMPSVPIPTVMRRRRGRKEVGKKALTGQTWQAFLPSTSYAFSSSWSSSFPRFPVESPHLEHEDI